jgi:GT2 family glycosyltransferase
MPFAGTIEEAPAALGSLTALQLADGDELILADNCGAALDLPPARGAQPAPVRVIDAQGERSPAHARNAGAAAAGDTEWILFLDADTVAPPALLDRYFAESIGDDVGAVAGGISAASNVPSTGIAARYGAHKNFLDAGAHLAHPFMPRAAAANLLVRRAAFDAVGGFFEGLRAAEDTDFSWRLQRAGWTLVGRPSAAVQHHYRDSLRALRRQWRGYAAGRAWLGRRYDGFEPQPALLRAAGRSLGRAASGVSDAAARPAAPASGRSDAAAAPARDRVLFPVLDVILGVDELIGFALSNRPPAANPGDPSPRRVLVVDRFPNAEADVSAAGGPADAGPVRIEAAARAERAVLPSTRVTIVYREDDGPLDRARALASLAARYPGRVLTATARDRNAPSLAGLAPAASRLLADPAATLSPLSTDPRVLAAARRLGRLAGRESPRRDGWREMLTGRAKSSDHIPAADDREPKERR